MSTEEKTVTAGDLESLRHMLGINQSTPQDQWGYRNYFAAGGDDQIQSMERLADAGFVRCGGERWGLTYYFATEEGCKAAGLTTEQIKKVFEG